MAWKLKPIISAIFSLVAVAVPGELMALEIEGPAKVRDGDTIIIGDTTVNLTGIDAPEMDQLCLDQKGQRWNCGMEARRHLQMLVGNNLVTCRSDSASGKPIVRGRCALSGTDVAKSLVASGWALADGQPALYSKEDHAARVTRQGLWKGKFISPLDWRIRQADPALLGTARVTFGARRILVRSAFGAGGPAGECAVKANIISDGTCIFHRPKGRWYAKIKIDPASGDRWFCSASEARSAGCRETRR